MRSLLSLFLLVYGFSCFAQMPDTDIWLFELEKNEAGGLVVKKARNLTMRKGYDNQPSFAPNGKSIYYSSVREDQQADVYNIAVSGGKEKRITDTRESEYSPLIIDGKNRMATVTVEKDSAQRIHFSDLETAVHTRLDFDSVGYYCFVNTDTLVYFKLTSPFSLRFYAISTGEDKFISWSPIRSIKPINRHCFLYGVKDSVKVDFYQYDFFLRKATLLATYPSVGEDAYWHSRLGLLKTEGSQVLRFEPGKKTWEILFELSSFGIKKAGRLAFDPKDKYLLLVETN